MPCQQNMQILILCVLGVVKSTALYEEKLIGWQGDTYKPRTYQATDGSAISNDRSKAWVQTISWKPRAQVYHNFLSDQEARHILELARYQMKRSMVVGPNDTGVVDSIRTSAGTFLPRHQDPVISAIEQRLALWTRIPIVHQEEMQVLRYGRTNKYGPHLDGLERVCTVLMYLVAPEEGGETTFVKGEWAHPEVAPPNDQLSACAKGHVAFKPKRGDALLFWDTLPDGNSTDFYGEHTGCPVVSGVKWNAVKWIHGVPFNPEAYEHSLQHGRADPEPDPGLCTDDEARCGFWADHGECQKNPGYMMGKPEGHGACRKACKDCEPCDTGDKACMDRNRVRGGYLVFDDAEFGF